MSMDFIQPVVLVVKAPNQQIADQTVECAWDWTVRKLKDHLATVYPSQPSQDQQKLIYYGRLLLDHLTLKDVLKQYDGQSTHTVHLVCSELQGSMTKSDSFTAKSTTSIDSTSSMDSTDGLRRRTADTVQHGQAENQPNNPTSSGSPQTYETYYQQHIAQMAALYTQNSNMAAQNPNQQLMLYQQMYAQQMAQYMQYWQNGYQPLQQTNLAAPTPVTTPPQTPPVPAAPQVQPPRRENNNVVMNAGAGGAGALFDDEEQEHDWLDWFYTGCKFSALSMIIYFYSTLPRAVVGVLFFIFLYMYQQGWFNAPPRRLDLNPAPERAPAPPVRAPDVNPDQPRVEPGEEVTENSNTNDDNTRPEPETPPAVSRIYLTWTFFKTFFTSLLPRPQAVV